MYVQVHSDTKNLLITVFAKKAVFGSYVVSFSCLECFVVHLNLKAWIPTESVQHGHDIANSQLYLKMLCYEVTLHLSTSFMDMPAILYIIIYIYIHCT